MILIYTALLLNSIAGPSAPQSQTTEHGPVARRIASTAILATQEYRLGVAGGRVVLQPEVDEAVLFLTEARRQAAALPAEVASEIDDALGSALALIDRTAAPDSVGFIVLNALNRMAAALGVSLEEIPESPPVLSRGAEIYQRQCASCHGASGKGDGPAAWGLDPRPVDLSDWEGLQGTSPLDFFRRISSGTPGTGMPAYEGTLSSEDRWAVAVYASVLRLPSPEGTVPAALQAFPTTARMSDESLLAALGPGAKVERLAAVRMLQTAVSSDRTGTVFAQVRRQLDSAYALAAKGRAEEARQMAFDAYLTFEQLEREIRAKKPELAADLEASFSELRSAVSDGAPAAALGEARNRLAAGLESAERVVADTGSPFAIFVQSFVILLREGLEAILIIGALLAFLSRSGATSRRREIHLGAAGALVASLITAVLIESVFRISPARQEVLEGAIMVVAVAMLFYVSYWLLSKVESAKWTGFVKGQVQAAMGSRSTWALVSVAFLAVYREGFETVLFYKALWVSGGNGAGNATVPLLGGILIAALVLVVVYIAVNRFGMRLPLRPFFAATSAFLYYMAFVFSGKAVAELQSGGVLPATVIQGAPRIPVLGVYPTVETLVAQGVLVVLALVALIYVFMIAPRRNRAAAFHEPPVESVAPTAATPDYIRSLERIETDLAEVRAELERMKSAMRSESEMKASRG